MTNNDQQAINKQKTYQEEIKQFYIFKPEVAEMYLLLGLGAEIGEVQDLIAKRLRDGTDDEMSLSLELADVYFFVMALADHYGLTQCDLETLSLNKLHGRKERGTLGGSGNYR